MSKRTFRRVVGILAVVYAVAIAVGLLCFRQYLKRYEENHPVGAMNAYFAALASNDTARILADADFPFDDLNTQEAYLQYLREKYPETDKRQYAELPSDTDGRLLFAVYANDQQRGTLTLQKREDDTYRVFSDWELRPMFTVTSPAVPLLNGVSLAAYCEGGDPTVVPAFAGVGGTLPTERQSGEFDEELIAVATGLTAKLEGLLDQTQLNHMLAEIFQVVSRANKYIDETAPWILAREEANRTRLATVLYNLLETIRIITVPLSAFMPETMPKIWEQIGASEADVAYSTAAVFGTLPANVTVHKGDIIFPRIDVEKEIDELNQLILAAQPKEEPQEPEFTPQPLAEEIDIDTFGKTDLRVAKVLECEKVKKSKKLLKLQLDDGMGGRQVVSGIAPWYKPEDLIGKKIVLVANLKPAKLCGVESCGMICAADMPNGDVKVIFPDESLPVGSKIR